jgi:phage shock protein A
MREAAMNHQIPVAPRADEWVARLSAHVHRAWHSRPASDAQRWLLGKIGLWAAGPGLDAAYRRQLLELTRVRRAVADLATKRKRLEVQLGELERQAGLPADPGMRATDASQVDGADQGQTARGITEQVDDLRRRYAEIQAKEERVTAASVRLQAEINAFRAGKDTTKAAYTAAEQAAEAVWAEVSRCRPEGVAYMGITEAADVRAGALRPGPAKEEL